MTGEKIKIRRRVGVTTNDIIFTTTDSAAPLNDAYQDGTFALTGI